MNNIKKFACHRIYKESSLYQGLSLIVINENGEVVSCNLLTHETSDTEWIGGVVVLSSKNELFLEKSFSSFLQKVHSIEKKAPVYAWHIYPFDFEKEDFLLQSQLKKLH